MLVLDQGLGNGRCVPHEKDLDGSLGEAQLGHALDNGRKTVVAAHGIHYDACHGTSSGSLSHHHQIVAQCALP